MPKPIFVPVAYPIAEAEAMFNASRAVFAQLTGIGQAASPAGRDLARGMVLTAEAIDKARSDAEGDAGAAA